MKDFSLLRWSWFARNFPDLLLCSKSLYLSFRALEKVKGSAQLQASYSSSDSSLYTNPKGSAVSAFDGGSDSSSESEAEEPPNRKKLRVEAS
uniref:Uncharacterized protein n=1 Tax=Amphiprion percula TaxID=161767 RepID=A0A3P8RQY4_AMPPE